MTKQINWTDGSVVTGRFVAGNGRQTQCSLLFCGDWAPEGEYLRALEAEPTGIYGTLFSEMTAVDGVVLNLEGVVSDGAQAPIVKDGCTIRLPETALAALTCLPNPVACLANNHTFDLGCEGLAETLHRLAHSGITHVGAGLNDAAACQPCMVACNGIRVVVVNAAEGEEGRSQQGSAGVAGMDLHRIAAQVKDLRADVDAVVVVLHGGREYLPVPAPYLRDACRMIAEAGADLVVGHHPHVPQGMEIHAGTPIAYSLGNFIFTPDRAAPLNAMGYCLAASFDGEGLVALRILPYRTGANGIQGVEGEERAGFLHTLEKLSAFASDDDRLHALWDAYSLMYLQRFGLTEVADAVARLGASSTMARTLLQTALGETPGIPLWRRLPRSAGMRFLDRVERREGRSHTATQDAVVAARRRAAAVLRNRFDTIAHREMFLTALRQVMNGRMQPEPEWAVKQLDEWSVLS